MLLRCQEDATALREQYATLGRTPAVVQGCAFEAEKQQLMDADQAQRIETLRMMQQVNQLEAITERLGPRLGPQNIADPVMVSPRGEKK